MSNPEITRQESTTLKSFAHYCTCGGFARSMNERPESNPHMIWCAQKMEYDAWKETQNASIAPSRLKNANALEGI